MSYLAKTTAKGRDYYKIMESFQEGGKTKHRVLLNIGPLKNLFALLPPNVKDGTAQFTSDERIATVKTNVHVDPVRCRKHGATHILSKVADWLRVTEMMDDIFRPNMSNHMKRSTGLLLAALQSACEPGSKRDFSDWFARCSLPDYMNVDPKIFTSQHIWEQMDEITGDEIKEFETKLFQRILDQFPQIKSDMDSLPADFTNYFVYISTQSYPCELGQLGQGQEGQTGQKLFNVAVVTFPMLGIPIASMVYEENHNHTTGLKDFINELKDRLKDIISLEQITFVFDGGDTTEETLSLIPGHFITRGSIQSSVELYEVALSSFEDVILEEGKIVKSYRTKAKQYGKRRTVIVTFSDQLRQSQIIELDEKLRKFDEQILEINARLCDSQSTEDKSLTKIEKRMNRLLLPQDYFADMIKVEYEVKEVMDPIILKEYKKARKNLKEGQAVEINGVTIGEIEDIPIGKVVTKIKYTVQENKKKEVIDKYFGKHLLVTDLDHWETSKILNVYRDQKFIDGFFRDSNNTDHFPVCPIYHWTDQKIQAHIMVCHLGLTLARLSTYVLKRELDYNITCSELLDRLDNVQECLVTVEMNGEQLQPIKTLSQLDGKDLEVWQATEKLLVYIKENPFKQDLDHSTLL